MLFVWTAAVHAADLSVCGNTVKYTGYVSSSAIKSGTVHYDASSKVLTLSNAVIETSSYSCIVNNGIEDLSITFLGTCSLKSNKCGIQLFKRTELLGSASSTVSIETSSTSVYDYAIGVDGAELIFRANGPHFTVKANNTYAVDGCSNNNSKLTLQGAWLKSTGKKGSIVGFVGGITLGNPTVGESIIASPHWIYYSLEFKKKNDTACDEVRIMPKSSYYGVRIKGEALTEYTTSSDVSWLGSYSPTNKVVAVYEIDATDTDFKDPVGVLVEEEGITVRAMRSGAFIKSNLECVVFAKGGTILVPSSCSLNLNTASTSNVALAIQSGTVTLTGGGNFNTVGFIYGIFNGTFSRFVNDKTLMSIQADNATPINAQSTFNEVMVKTPSNVELGYDGFIQYKGSHNTYTGSITVGLSQKYNMWANGIRVDESNCYRMGRLFGKKSILGYDIDEESVTYNPSTKTLALNGIMVENLNEGITTSIDDLTINVTQANLLGLSGSNTALSIKGNTTIVGINGTAGLKLKNCKNGIDVDDCTLTVKEMPILETDRCSGFGLGSTSSLRGNVFVNYSVMEIEGDQACISNLRKLNGWRSGFINSPDVFFYNDYARTGGEYGDVVKGEKITLSTYTATVKVGDTTMTESNVDNLAYGVSFDYINHTLKLQSAYVNGSTGIDVNCPNLRVDMHGNNTITTTGNGICITSAGAKLYGNSSKLTITAGESGLVMLGAQNNPPLIEDCDITINSSQAGITSYSTTTGTCIIRNSQIISDATTFALGGFQKYQFEGCHVAVPALYTYKTTYGKYKLMEGDQPATHVEIRLGEIPTEIDAITDDVTATEEIFDLQGRRVQDMQRGNVYIVRKGGKVKKSVRTL